MPAVSVVIPAYNAARTVAATLDSLSAQTLQDFEAVLVDDGSADDTCAIASSYAQRDSRLRVIKQPNSGVADARNAGIRATTAPLIAALDADDVWHPTFLAKMSAALPRTGSAVFAYARSRVMDLEGRVLHDGPPYEQTGWVLHRLLLGNFIGNASAVMFRRDAAERAGCYERRLRHDFDAQGAEDWLLWLRMAARARVVAVPDYLVGYRLVPGAMSDDTLRNRHSRRHALRLLFAEFPRGNSWPARRALGAANAKCFLHELRDGEIALACRSLLDALRLDALGTSRLLFGAERVAWFKRHIAPHPYPEHPPAFRDLEADRRYFGDGAATGVAEVTDAAVFRAAAGAVAQGGSAK